MVEHCVESTEAAGSIPAPAIKFEVLMDASITDSARGRIAYHLDCGAEQGRKAIIQLAAEATTYGQCYGEIPFGLVTGVSRMTSIKIQF